MEPKVEQYETDSVQEDLVESMIEVVHTRRQVEKMGYGKEVGRAMPKVERYTITTQMDNNEEDNVMDSTMIEWLVDKEEMEKFLLRKWTRGSKLQWRC